LLSTVLLLLLVSSLAGFLGAIFGLGGGVLVVPALTALFRVPIHVAIGASLISVVATSAGASVAFVRDGWTNLRIAMVLEVATVSGALVGASLSGIVSPRVLEGLFAASLLIAAQGMVGRGGDHILDHSEGLADRLGLGGTFPDPPGAPRPYGVRRVGAGALLMMVAGAMSGMLGVGAGSLKVTAMDTVMGLPFKVSSATSNFMIGVTAGAGAIVFLARGDVATAVAAPVALGVTGGAVLGGRLLAGANVRWLRPAFLVVLLLVAAQMGWRAWRG
jgi:uncharacterized membrane protein YfcA